MFHILPCGIILNLQNYFTLLLLNVNISLMNILFLFFRFRMTANFCFQLHLYKQFLISCVKPILSAYTSYYHFLISALYKTILLFVDYFSMLSTDFLIFIFVLFINLFNTINQVFNNILFIPSNYVDICYTIWIISSY